VKKGFRHFRHDCPRVGNNYTTHAVVGKIHVSAAYQSYRSVRDGFVREYMPVGLSAFQTKKQAVLFYSTRIA
jgi:hypothetical protein